MEHLWIFAAFILAIVYVFDRSVLRFDSKAFLWFLKVLIIGSLLSIVLNSILGRFPPLPLVPVSSLLFVWGEDIIFSLLPLYYGSKLLPERCHVPVIILSSFVFGAFHLYQGLLFATVISLYPYISLHLGKKYGWGTVCVSHVTYDLLITFNVWAIHAIV